MGAASEGTCVQKETCYVAFRRIRWSVGHPKQAPGVSLSLSLPVCTIDIHTYLCISTFIYCICGGLISRHLPKTHAITAGTQKNRISRRRQNSHHQQQITMGTAHSAHQPLTSPSLNQTMRTLCRTPRKFIPTLTPTTANHTVHRSLITAWKI